MESSEELALFDLTRQRLSAALSDQVSDSTDIENTLTAYAYWVCSFVRLRSSDWEKTLREYTARAMRNAEREMEAERSEVARLRRALRAVPDPGVILDVGAGWGRLAPLYSELNLRPVFVEPTELGARLMRRKRLSSIVRSVGEALPFPTTRFPAALIAWVLHHDSSGLDAAAILREVARVLTAGGWLFSIEPLGKGFEMDQWTALFAQPGVGIEWCDTQEFFQMPDSDGEIERHTLVIGRKTAHLLKRGAMDVSSQSVS